MKWLYNKHTILVHVSIVYNTCTVRVVLKHKVWIQTRMGPFGRGGPGGRPDWNIMKQI